MESTSITTLTTATCISRWATPCVRPLRSNAYNTQHYHYVDHMLAFQCIAFDHRSTCVADGSACSTILLPLFPCEAMRLVLMVLMHSILAWCTPTHTTNPPRHAYDFCTMWVLALPAHSVLLRSRMAVQYMITHLLCDPFFDRIPWTCAFFKAVGLQFLSRRVVCHSCYILMLEFRHELCPLSVVLCCVHVTGTRPVRPSTLRHHAGRHTSNNLRRSFS